MKPQDQQVSDLEAWVRSAKAGDRMAFGCLFTRLQPRLQAWVNFNLGCKLRAKVEGDDVMQDISLQALRSIGTFEWRGEGSFIRWITGIARHVIHNLWRFHFNTAKNGGPEGGAAPLAAGESSGDFALDDATSPDQISPLRVLRRVERKGRLERSLELLAPAHREVIFLALFEDLPMKEIGRRMGRSEDAVSMLLLRALHRLRAHFGNTESLGLPRSQIHLRVSG